MGGVRGESGGRGSSFPLGFSLVVWVAWWLGPGGSVGLAGPELRVHATWTTKLTDADFSLGVTESDSSFVSAQRGTSVDSGGAYQANADAADVVQDGVVNDTDVASVAGDIGKSSAGETNIVAKSSDATPPKIGIPRGGRVKLTFEREGTTKPVHISYGGLDIYSYGGKCPPTYSDADTLTAYTRSQAQRSKFTVRAATFVDEGAGWTEGNLECLVELKVSCIGVDITEFPEAVSLYDTIEVRADARASGEGTLAWTIMGEGSGTFGDPSSPTTTFSPTTLGSATVVVSYNSGQAMTSDTHQVTIVAFDADITSAPVVMGLGDSETVTATVSPAGGTLAWSLEGEGGGTFSPADALESCLTATTPGSATIVLSYTSGGVTITEKRPLAILDVRLVDFPRYVAHAALLQSEPTPEGAGNLEWSILGGTGGGTLTGGNSATALFEAATAGSVQVQVRYSTAHVWRTDSDTFTVLTCRITNKPSVPSFTRVGDTFAVTAEGAPLGEGTLAWSVIFGPGDGEFEDAGAPSTTFTATQAGAATLEAAYGTAGATAVDRVGLTILGLRLVAVPEVVSLSDAVTMAADPQPLGAAVLAWSLSGEGEGTFSPPDEAATTFTPTKVGAATVRVTYGTAGVTCEATSPVVIVGHDVDIEAGPPAVMVAGETCLVSASISPEGGTFSWSLVGDAQGTFENASSPSTVFTATGAGRAVVRASYAKDGQTATDERGLTIIAVDIVQGAEALAWGETMTVACEPQPWDAGGTLAWSLIAGSGSGELEPTTGLWSDLTPTAAGTMSIQVGYTTGGKTAFDTLVVRVLRAEITSMPSVIAVGGQAQVTANVSPPAGADGTALLWSLLYDGDALVEFEPANAATATMTGTAGGTTTVMVWQYYETAGVYVTDQRELTVLGVDITEAPSQVSVGDTAAFTAAPVPPGAALLEWSIAGDGGGTFSDTTTVSTVFTPTTPGAAVVTVTYSTGGVTASDTCAVTILGLDVDLSSWPAYMVRGETATVSAWVDGNGDLLEWFLIGGSGSGSFDPAEQANLAGSGTKSTTFTATAGGVAEFQAGYSAASNRALVATDVASLTVLSADITMLPATVSVGDTVSVRARALPESVGALTWSLEGTGEGTFTDPSAASTKLLPTQPGTAVVSVQYTLGGKTASASKTITILPFDVDITTYPVFIATTKSDTLQATTDPPGNEGLLAWSLMPSTGGGQLDTTAGGTVILTGDTPGLIAIAVEWTSGAQTARDEVGVAVVDMHIETKPAGAGLDHPITLEAHALPVAVGLFEWSVLGGPGGGTVNDTASATIEFTPTTAGSVTLGVTYKVGSVVLTDTCQFPIVLQDVDITTAPAALAVGGQAAVGAVASPSGGTLAWSVMPDWSGDGTFSDTTQASTTFTATQAGGARLAVSYTSGGITVTEERYLPILSVEMDTPAVATLSVGDALPLTCWETPWGEAVLEWSVTGDGGGSFSPTNESSTVFTPTTPGAAVLTVTYSTGGATAMDTYPVTILACDVDITVPPPTLMVQDETATVQAVGTPEGGTLEWAMMADGDNTGDGSFSDPASPSPVFTATTPGYALMRVAYTKDGATAYETTAFTILGIEAASVPPVLSLGDTLPVSAAETPWLGGTLEWSVLSGPGGGSFDDTTHASAVFTPSTTGQVTLQIKDTYEGKSAKDTLTFTIVACDVDILQAPSQLVAGTTAPLSCSVSPEGGSLAWSVIPSGGSATVDDPAATSTFLTAGDTGLVYIQAAYTQGGEVAYETRQCLIIDNVIPDAPTGAFVTAGWGNDTHVVNCSNVDYAVVEVALPETTKSYDTIEVTLTDQYDSHAIGTAPGGETTVWVVVDCSALNDGNLTVEARAYNAAGSPSTLTGTPAVKDATAPTVNVEEPDDDIVVEVSYVRVKGTCPDGDIASFTILGEETALTSGAFDRTLFLTNGSWGTYIEVTAEDEHRNVTTVTRYVEVAPLEVEITSPEDGAVLDATSVNVAGTVKGPKDIEVFVNGQRALRDGESFTLSNLPLTEGPTVIGAHAHVAHDFVEDVILVIRDSIVPVVGIELPGQGAIIPDTKVTVSGIVQDENLQSVTVNGQSADLYGNYFVAQDIPLNTEGENDIIVVATDAAGHIGQGQVTVTRDTTDPALEITSPGDGDTVHRSLVTVQGTVEYGVTYLAVNGRVVDPAGTSWSKELLLEAEGENTITAVAYDAAGNQAEVSITVTRNLPPKLEVTGVEFSAQSTVEQVKVAITGTVDDPQATVACGDVQGTNTNGSFLIDGVNVYPGRNLLTVTATDADGQVTSADVVVELDPGSQEGYPQPGDSEAPDAGFVPMLTVGLTPAKDAGEGGGEKSFLGAAMPFTTFGALLDGESEPKLTVETYDQEFNAFVATDLRFAVDSGTCAAEIASATIYLATDFLTLFDNGNRVQSDTVIKWKKDSNGQWALFSPFEGLWWDVDATTCGSWSDVFVQVTYKDPDAAQAAGCQDWSDDVRGNNVAVYEVKIDSVTNGKILGQDSSGNYTLIINKDKGAAAETEAIAQVTYSVSTVPDNLLADQVSWQYGPDFAGTGKTLTKELRASESRLTVTAFGDAPNANDGSGAGGQGPQGDSTPDSLEPSAQLTVDGGSVLITIESPEDRVTDQLSLPILLLGGNHPTATVHFECFDDEPTIVRWQARNKDGSEGTTYVRIVNGDNAGERVIEFEAEEIGDALLSVILAAPDLSAISEGSICRSKVESDARDRVVLARRKVGAEAEAPAEGPGAQGQWGAGDETEVHSRKISKEERDSFKKSFLERMQRQWEGRGLLGFEETARRKEAGARACHYVATLVMRDQTLAGVKEIGLEAAVAAIKTVVDNAIAPWLKNLKEAAEAIKKAFENRKMEDAAIFKMRAHDAFEGITGGQIFVALFPELDKNLRRDFVFTVTARISADPPTREEAIGARAGAAGAHGSEVLHWWSDRNRKAGDRRFIEVVLIHSGKWDPRGKTLQDKIGQTSFIDAQANVVEVPPGKGESP